MPVLASPSPAPGTMVPCGSSHMAKRVSTQKHTHRNMAVGYNQWYHFGVGAPPILVHFSGDWDVHWGYGILTHGHISDLPLVDLTSTSVNCMQRENVQSCKELLGHCGRVAKSQVLATVETMVCKTYLVLIPVAQWCPFFLLGRVPLSSQPTQKNSDAPLFSHGYWASE